MSSPIKVAVIIPAAGSSSRMNIEKKKELLAFRNGTVLSNAILPFFRAARESLVGTFETAPFEITQVVVLTPTNESDVLDLKNAVKSLEKFPEFNKICFCEGGTTRQESVYKGLQFLAKDLPQFVLVHDGARPFLTEELVSLVVEGVRLHLACVPGLPIVDTVLKVDSAEKCVEYCNRDFLRTVQTPQGFVFKPFLEAHEKARLDTDVFTDDSKIWAKYVGDVFLCKGDPKNKKITYHEDIDSLAEKLC